MGSGCVSAGREKLHWASLVLYYYSLLLFCNIIIIVVVIVFFFCPIQLPLPHSTSFTFLPDSLPPHWEGAGSEGAAVQCQLPARLNHDVICDRKGRGRQMCRKQHPQGLRGGSCGLKHPIPGSHPPDHNLSLRLEASYFSLSTEQNLILPNSTKGTRQAQTLFPC